MPSVLGVGLDLEGHDIHHLLVVTSVRQLLRCACTFGCTWHEQQSFLRLIDLVAGRNCATIQNAAQLT